MRLEVDLQGEIEAMLAREVQIAERAVQRGLTAAGKGLQRDWRGQVEGAGLGKRLSRTVRNETFPGGGRTSLNAASLVWTRAPEILGAFERGALIRGKDGLWLAIPLPAAGTKGVGNKRITPGGWEQRTGLRLRFIYRKGHHPLLISDGERLHRGYSDPTSWKSTQRKRAAKVWTPIFVLVPQVKLRKRLDLVRDGDRWAGRVPGLILQNWPDR